MSKDFTVTVIDPDRAAEWQSVLGTTTVYVTTPIPQRMHFPDRPSALGFFMDVLLLTDAQRASLIEHLSRKFQVPAEEILEAIMRDPQHAVPILDENCIVSVANPQRWF